MESENVEWLDSFLYSTNKVIFLPHVTEKSRCPANHHRRWRMIVIRMSVSLQ